jgi:hypothetical protein
MNPVDDEAFGDGGVDENGVAQCGGGKAGEHGDLDGGDDFPGVHSKSGEAEDAIGLGINESVRVRSTETMGILARRWSSKAMWVKCGLPAQSPTAQTSGAVLLVLNHANGACGGLGKRLVNMPNGIPRYSLLTLG